MTTEHFTQALDRAAVEVPRSAAECRRRDLWNGDFGHLKRDIAAMASPHIVSGVLSAIDGPTLTLKNRGGKPVKVDDSQAAKNGRIGTPLELGVSLTAQGSIIEANGALEAVSIVRAKGTSGELWPADR